MLASNTTLRELHLGNCEVDDAGAAPIFANGVHLRVLHLNGNRLTTVPASVRGMARLEKLDLSYNKLVSVDAGILALEGTLQKLDLEGNDATMLQPPAPFARAYWDASDLAALFRYFREKNPHVVRDLMLASLDTTGALDGAFTELDLSGMAALAPGGGGEAAAAEWFTATLAPALAASRVRTLRLARNGWLLHPASPAAEAALRALGGLGGLATLDVSHNALRELPSALLELRQLTSLDLSNNELISVDAGILAPMGALQKLDLEGNDLDDASKAALVEATCFVTFDGMPEENWLESEEGAGTLARLQSQRTALKLIVSPCSITESSMKVGILNGLPNGGTAPVRHPVASYTCSGLAIRIFFRVVPITVAAFCKGTAATSASKHQQPLRETCGGWAQQCTFMSSA